MRTRDELLKVYAEKEPRDFLLVDVHQIGPGYDSEDLLTGMSANEHGLCVMVGMITQLSEAAGEGGLRILIGRKMSREKIEQALRHILEEVDFPEPRSSEDDREVKERMDEYERERTPAPADLRSIANEAIEFHKEGKFVKVLDELGKPKLNETGNQVYRTIDHATDAELAFYKKEMAPAMKPPDPPDLAELRAKGALLWPSLQNRRRGDR